MAIKVLPSSFVTVIESSIIVGSLGFDDDAEIDELLRHHKQPTRNKRIKFLCFCFTIEIGLDELDLLQNFRAKVETASACFVQLESRGRSGRHRS
jgi:hypothetical protein